METRYEHIGLNGDRVPTIVGTTMKVVELLVEQRAYGWSPEELHFQHPLAYCWGHREELDRDIERRSNWSPGCATFRSLRRWFHG